MKQPGIAFAAFGVVFLLCEFVWTRTPIGRCASRILLFGFGVAFPYLLVCLWLWRAGVFPRFWFWTVTLAQAYLIQRPLASWYSFLRRALPGILLPNFVLWILAAFGLALVCCRKAHRRAGLFTALLLLFSILAVSAGGSFNANYFAMLLPAAALAIGGGVASAERVRRWPVICFAAACACSVFVQRDYLFTMTPEEFSRITYGRNPFLEAVKVGDYIRANSRNDARIAVLGSEAEISFYSDRPLATGYLFAYSLMEEHRWAATLQGEMIGEIEASKPEFIVFVDNPLSWIVRAHSSRAIFYWAADYTSRYYEATGFVDMPWQGTVKYYWGPEAAARARPIETPLMYVGPGGREPDYSLTVYRRK
jgi:hypothetical protein